MPAAAVIPSLKAFPYVVAVKKLVAVARKRVTLRKSECSSQVSLHSSAKNDMPVEVALLRTYHMAARDWWYLVGTGEIG